MIGIMKGFGFMVNCIYKLSKELIESIYENIDLEVYKSVDEFIKCVNDKNPDAIFELSVLGQIGGCSEDEWMFFLKEASDLGCEGAIEQLADFNDMEDDPLYNPKKQLNSIKKIALKGNIRANYQLAIYCADNDKVDEAVKYMEFVGENSAGEIIGYVADFFESIGDYERAIKYYKKYRVYGDYDGSYLEGFEPDEDGVLECVYGSIAHCYYQLKDFSNANVFINKGIVINDSYCMFLKGLIYYENEDNNGEEQIDKAIEWFVKASNANSEKASFYLGKIYSNNDKYFDREKALYYFGKAGELANSCKPLIESLSLGNNLSKEDRFLKYIDNIIEAKVDVKTYPEIAENDLKKDFGNYWNKLSDFTKNVLVTGITIFMTFKNIDSNSNSNSNIKLDYSPVIISISRGLEKELRNVFFDKFKKYLIKTNANPNDFRRLRDFTYIDERRNYQFSDNNNWFTLGKLKYMVNEHSRKDYYGNSIKTMDYYLRDYCMNFALNKSQFSSDEEMHKKEVIEYMCDLSRDVSEISDVFRNESAHTNSTSSQDRATICINWIIKVKQLLLRFLEKLDYESLESL